MLIAIDYEPWNPATHKRPWIAKVVVWHRHGPPELEFGRFEGNEVDGGTAEIDANPGDIIRHDQPARVRDPASMTVWYEVTPDGDLSVIENYYTAQLLFRARHKLKG